MRKELRKILVPLLMVQTVAALIALSYTPLGPFIIKNLKLSPTEWGSIASVYFTGSILATIFAGILVDRFSLRRILSVSLVLTGAIMAFAPTLHTFATLLAMFFLMGTALSPVIPGTNKGIVVGIPPAEHGFAMGTKTAGVTLGQFFGAVSLPLIALTLGWQYTFFSLGILCMGTGIIFYYIFPELAVQPPGGLCAQPVPFYRIITFPLACVFFLGLTFTAFTISITTFFLPFLEASFGVKEVAGGIYLGVILICSVFTLPLLGLASDRLLDGRRKALLLFCGVGGAAVGLVLARAPQGLAPWALVLISIGFGCTIFSCLGLFSSLIMDISGPAKAGTVSGVGAALTKSGGVIGPLIFGYLVDLYSYSKALNFFSLFLLAVCFAASFIPLEKAREGISKTKILQAAGEKETGHSGEKI